MAPFRALPTALYLCDNGACYCGAHLGTSARRTGRDLSGQRIHRVTPAEAVEVAAECAREGIATYLACESCGRTMKAVAA